LAVDGWRGRAKSFAAMHIRFPRLRFGPFSDVAQAMRDRSEYNPRLFFRNYV
jgi:hypothetical protein